MSLKFNLKEVFQILPTPCQYWKDISYLYSDNKRAIPLAAPVISSLSTFITRFFSCTIKKIKSKLNQYKSILSPILFVFYMYNTEVIIT